jgi:hypothetical protein
VARREGAGTSAPAERTGPTVSETPIEGPAEDVAEQRAEVLPHAPGDRRPPEEPSWDADPADAAEQAAEVPFDEDEWR